jgi:hypothetical protein
LDFLSLLAGLQADDIDRLAGDAPTLKVALLEKLSRGMAERLKRATQWIASRA